MSKPKTEIVSGLTARCLNPRGGEALRDFTHPVEARKNERNKMFIAILIILAVISVAIGVVVKFRSDYIGDEALLVGISLEIGRAHV